VVLWTKNVKVAPELPTLMRPPFHRKGQFLKITALLINFLRQNGESAPAIWPIMLKEKAKTKPTKRFVLDSRNKRKENKK
jgi:hypothetical protein